MLVNCAVYREGAKLADISIEQISDYLTDPANFVWVALKDATPAELETMREEFGLHELAVEDARHGHQRPKIEEYGSSVFVVLHTVEANPSGGLSAGEVAIFADRNYVLSVRRHCEQGFSNVRERCEREPHLLKHGSAFVLYALMDTVVDRYFPILAALQDESDAIEDSIFANKNPDRTNIERLYDLKHKLMAMQHAIVPMADAIGKLHGGRVPGLCQSMQEYFRDVSDHLLRASRSVESLREMSASAVQVNLAMITLAESDVTKKLASYGALFAAPTAIAGVYGMNFKFMPELEMPYGYPLAIAMMILVDIFLWWRFRKAGWL